MFEDLTWLGREVAEGKSSCSSGKRDIAVERTKESSNNGWAGGNRAKRVHSFFTIHIQYKYTTKAEENIKGNY